VDTLREADPATVVITPDAHFAYYRNRTVVERLYEDALRPAIETGAEEIWVVGISMGGAGALGLAQAHGDVIDRVLLLGPYMGGKIAREISDAGGLGAWEEHAVEGEGDRAAFFRRIWAWLDGYTVPGTERPDLHVGVGRDDRGFAASELLGVELPAGNFVAAEGGHDWSVWTPLFERFVDENTTGGNGASKAAPGGMSP
jgi:pimeloyl-ACP methyl ester carboxylesterase